MAEVLTEQGNFEFWEMFHSLVRHGNKPEDTEHAKEAFAWFTENVHNFRLILRDPTEVAINAVLYNLSHDIKEMPGIVPVREYIEGMKQNAGLLTELDEYDERVANKELKVWPIPDLTVLLRKLALIKQLRHVALIAKRMAKINNGGGEKDEKLGRILEGPRDAMMYVVREMEKGVLTDTDSSNRVIVVNDSALNIVDEYTAMCNVPQFDTGVSQIRFERGDFLGVLGYKGGGKSTFSRFIAYNIAAEGQTVLHTTIETDPGSESRKYIFIHSQNPKFNGEFKNLKWTDWVDRRMSPKDLDALAFVGKDFHKNFDGKLIIRKPSSDSWHVCKTMIELQDMATPIDVLLLDYVQILNPTPDKGSDERSQRGNMIKDVRQFALSFGSDRKVGIISPVQANENGLKYATEHEGAWPLNAVNNDKELSASMTVLVGVFDMGIVDNQRIMVLSCSKDRERGVFNPFSYTLHGAGWCQMGKGREFNVEQARKVTESYVGGSFSSRKLIDEL